jgi:hypothetical protein
MNLAERIQDYLRRLTPLTRSCLLTELDRLEASGVEMPGAAEVQAKLRAEFRKDGPNKILASNPVKYFFAPLEPLLVEGAPDHANSGRIQRGTLTAIWEWISRDLLPTMARDYVNGINDLVAADKQRDARQAAAAFQTKVVKYLESTLGTQDGVDRTRAKLAIYTASPAAYSDLIKMRCVLRARDALAKFADALPAAIDKFEDARLSKVAGLLDAFGKEYAEEIPFALALVALRLKTPWQLIYLATKAAPSKKAADIAATPYAITVSMVMDRLDDKRLALRVALKSNRILVAKEILTWIYDTEDALRSRIDLLDESDWGKRLDHLMDAIAALVQSEVSRFPDKLGHVLGSRSRRRRSWSGRLTHLAGKGRDALSGGVKKLVGQTEKSPG